MYTTHSEYGQIKTVYLKSIATGFINQEKINAQWQSLNYINCPNYEKSLVEYAEFVRVIEASCGEIKYFNKDGQTGMDSIYCRDASIATDYGMIICNMGKGQRKGEPEAQRKIFEHQGVKVLDSIETPGTLEGGDVAWVDEKTLAVGHTYRTNPEGIQQLKAMLKPHGINVIVAQMPHYKGVNDVFHLMSVFSPVDKNLAVVYSPLMPVYFRNLLLKKGYQLIEVPDEEFDSMGCNVLALSPRNCLIVNGNPKTKSALEAAGCKVREYAGQHISVPGGGGPTCLTRPIFRLNTM